MKKHTIHEANQSTLISFRRAILRPTEIEFSRCRYDGDTDIRSRHIVAKLDGSIVGMASLIHDPKTFGEFGDVNWRIRGVGVFEPFRKNGIATAMLEDLIARVDKSEDPVSWLSARISQRNLYERLGYEAASDEYEIPGTGPHVNFVRPRGRH